MKTQFIYINDQQSGRAIGEGVFEKDYAEFRKSCWKQRIYGSLTAPEDVTPLDGRVVPITAAMYADELLHQLETAVAHLKNLQTKYQPEIPFAIGGYEYVIALAKGTKELKLSEPFYIVK